MAGLLGDQGYVRVREGIVRQWKRLYDDQSLKDVEIVLMQDGEKLMADSLILRLASPVFEAMLTHDFVERRTMTLQIDDCSGSEFRFFLRLLYTGQMDPTDWPLDPADEQGVQAPPRQPAPVFQQQQQLPQQQAPSTLQPPQSPQQQQPQQPQPSPLPPPPQPQPPLLDAARGPGACGGGGSASAGSAVASASSAATAGGSAGAVGGAMSLGDRLPQPPQPPQPSGPGELASPGFMPGFHRVDVQLATANGPGGHQPGAQAMGRALLFSHQPRHPSFQQGPGCGFPSSMQPSFQALSPVAQPPLMLLLAATRLAKKYQVEWLLFVLVDVVNQRISDLTFERILLDAMRTDLAPIRLCALQFAKKSKGIRERYQASDFPPEVMFEMQAIFPLGAAQPKDGGDISI
eukprot:TRINITY_DN4765_c1_g1_i2.p1 TRINITY_DN4765_c1_g1~~TRINITY_DN4765_c1_g1_i2.p1  ORF type:complete len:438 (-),score=88.96 TRINITY_DN4765_c1_g1_i2:44-1255(-)